ncbi:MAG: hypothetical protein O2960_13750 [Verrucomicrobia bacterium]|nr:hypothetical protein [Verrucomicrobiota bacterium]
MEDFIPFGGRFYFFNLAMMLFSRGMDFLSTWIATPNLILEANPIARYLGWRTGIALNIIICIGLSAWPLPAIVIITMSLLVAARNFQFAWLMRSMGEERYSIWFSERLAHVGLGLFLLCLFAQTGATAMIGGALMYFSRCTFGPDQIHLIPFSVGMGILTYAFAVTVFTLLAIRRIRRRCF